MCGTYKLLNITKEESKEGKKKLSKQAPKNYFVSVHMDKKNLQFQSLNDS